MNDTVLQVQGLCKNYPAFTLSEVSFSLEAGRIMGFIGRNGAGKTTTLKSILGLVHPDAGEIRYFGLHFAQNEQRIKEQIGYVPYLTRFPGGVSNTVSESYCPGIMTALASDLQAKGYQYYDWNVSSSDASGNHVPVDTIVQSSCAYGSFTNVILLCHDSGAKTTTVEALPQIIEYYQSQGFVCKAIDRSTVVVHHHINN